MVLQQLGYDIAVCSSVPSHAPRKNASFDSLAHLGMYVKVASSFPNMRISGAAPRCLVHSDRTAAAACLASRDGDTADWIMPDHPGR